jgi:hypothetical protein
MMDCSLVIADAPESLFGDRPSPPVGSSKISAANIVDITSLPLSQSAIEDIEIIGWEGRRTYYFGARSHQIAVATK